MSKFAKMPIDESPWVDRHDAEDVENYIQYYRSLASGIADLLSTEESRTADSFITGAQQSLARFNIATRAHKKTKYSSFRFSEQKEGDQPVSVFLVADPSRINAQKQVLGLIQWCMFQELKRSTNKHRPVYLLADEATNCKISDLSSLLTWGREYNLRLHIIIQSFSAFRKTYGAEALKTLLSETEIKQFLAGQREPETLAMIERMLGEQSIIAQGHRGQAAGGLFGIDGADYREEGRVLMTTDEIRRTDKTILIIRKNKPMLTDLPPIAAIAPWRKLIDVNPFYGKPYLLPMALRLHHRDGPLLLRLAKAIWRLFGGRTR